MKTEFYRRTKAAFFSYSSKDAALAHALVGWLKGCAGLDIWTDAKDLAAGGRLESAIETGVRGSRAYILLLTPNALTSNWVEFEHGVAHAQQREHAGFKRIVLVTPDVMPETMPSCLEGLAQIRLPSAGGLDGASAARLLESLRADAGGSSTEDDVFVTRTWRAEQSSSRFADTVCRWLVDKAGFRLIGDEPRDDYVEMRLRNVVSSCRVYLALVPPRTPEELKYLLADLRVAQQCAIPVTIVADRSVIAMAAQGQLYTPDGEPIRFDGAQRVLPVEMDAGGPSPTLFPELGAALQQANLRPGRAQARYSVFYAAEPASLRSDEREDIQRVVRGITGRRCVFPDDIDGAEVADRLLDEIGAAVTTIADLSSGGGDPWVYAGVARAARRPVALLSTEENLALPALLSGYRPRRYRTHAERLGYVHAAVYDHRRLVLNQEVLRWN